MLQIPKTSCETTALPASSFGRSRVETVTIWVSYIPCFLQGHPACAEGVAEVVSLSSGGRPSTAFYPGPPLLGEEPMRACLSGFQPFG